MKTLRFLGAGLPPAVLGILLFLSALPAPASASPLHPDLWRGPGSEAALIPPEPQTPVLSAGVLGTAAGVNGRRWTGHPRLLVLLVDFEDRPADRNAHPPEVTQRLLFSEGLEPYGSLREYYRAATYDRIQFDGAVFGWFRLPLLYEEYANGQSGLCHCFPKSADGMVVHAFQAAMEAGVDLREFDNDGPDGIPGSGDDDGILDGLAVVFVGYGAERTGSLGDIRSHFGQTVNNLESRGVRAPDYLAFPAAENVGIAVHEVGHLLGAPDLYDRSSRGNGIGYYSVMALGNWFNNAREPGGPDPYTRVLWGVLEPEVLTVDEPGLSLPPILETPRAFRLWTRGEPGPEYFLLEYRVARGLDRFLFGDGLLLYHVNETVQLQSHPARYMVSVIQADGLSSLEGQTPRNLGEFGDYFPGLHEVRNVEDGTVPDTRDADGDPTGVALRNIQDPGPLAVFDAEVGRFLWAGPYPRLRLIPEGGLFQAGVEPGGIGHLRVSIENQGTRLPAGTVRIDSRDPRVVLPQPVVLPVPGLGALQSWSLEDPIAVTVQGVSDTDPALIPLEAAWEGPAETWSMAAPIPLAGNVRRAEDFEVNPTDVRVQVLPGSAGNPWSYGKSLGHDASGGWGTPGYGPNTDAALLIGPVSLAEGISEVRFRQLVDLHTAGDYAYDGVFLEASPDGGSQWTSLEPVGGYPIRFGFSEGNGYAGTPVWAGRAGVWEEVTVLVPFSGPTLFRFHFVSDFTASGDIYGGWRLGDFLVRSWSRTHSLFVDPPRVEGREAVVEFEVSRLFEADIPTTVTLHRDSGAGEVLVGTWEVGDRLVETVALGDLEPWRTERLWFHVGSGERYGPFLVDPAPASRPRLLDATAAVLSRRAPTSVHYRVPGTLPSPVTLDLFDIRGARVARLEEGVREPGSHVHQGFPGGLPSGGLGSGVYFLKLTGTGFVETRRVVVLP